MKKALYLFIISVLILSNIWVSNAIDTSSVNKNKLIKEIILTRNDVKKVFSNWDKINEGIKNFFIEIRKKSYVWKTDKLEELKTKLESVYEKLENKSSLSINERKIKILVNNLLLRIIKELYY